MSVIDLKKGYVLPEITLSEEDLARILPQDSPILVEEFIVCADPLFTLLEEASLNSTNKAAQAMAIAPPQDGEIALKEGFSKPLRIEKNLPLHEAARLDDADKVKALLEAGCDVNQEDNRSSRPFHIAAFSGSNKALPLLISAGSDLKDKAIGGYSALDLALRNHHYETARTLVATSEFNVHTDSPDGKAPLLMIYEALEAEISAVVPTQLDSIIDAMREMVRQTDFCYILEDEGSYLPLVMKVKVLMSYATSSETYEKLNDLVEVIEHQDPSFNAYIASLDLLHHFPTDKTYDFKLPHGKSIPFAPEGHFVQYTTKLAYDSLTAYLEKLTPENSTLAEREVFHTLQEIYRDAVDFKQKMMQADIIEEALALYNQGDTILLPSGWEGHFVNIILNKEMGLYVTANSGERYIGEPVDNPHLETMPTKPIEPAGLLFYHLQNGNQIDFNFIQSTLANSDKLTLEYAHQHQYGLNKRVYEIELLDQEFNNCGWESHRDAIQGLLFMELMHGGMAQDDARDLAKTCFQKWDNFHGSFVIDRYIQHGYGLSVDSIIDILKTTTHDSSHKEHSEKLMNLLQSEYYQADYQQWLAEHHESPSSTEIAQPEIHPLPITHFTPEIVPEVMA